jgi:hypothetical protein
MMFKNKMVELKIKPRIQFCETILFFFCLVLCYVAAPDIAHGINFKQGSLFFISYFTFSTYFVLLFFLTILVSFFLFIYYICVCIVNRTCRTDVKITFYIGGFILVFKHFCGIMTAVMALEIFQFDFVTPIYLALICFHLIKNLIPI